MRGGQGGTHPGLVLGFAIAPIAIAVAGWILAQTGPDRISHPSEWTAAWVHCLAASTFAVVFGLSAVINLIVVVRRIRDAPRSFRPTGYPLWQALVVVFGLAWAVAVATSLSVTYVEMGLGGAVAVTSIVACSFAARPDPDVIAKRGARRATQTPESRKRSMKVRGVVAIGGAVLVVGGLVTAQLLIVVRKDCDVVGSGVVNGTSSFYTSNCGDFALDPARTPDLDVSEVLGSGGTLDITTQGYRLGLPPLPVVVSVSPSE